ncbi:MAG: hypothetical protein EP330_21805 [Deltaproteobacteria bacterium]|nr:MAG: hypothetical protein EP330_21805 [Deltaproteobacteria bacterium]
MRAPHTAVLLLALVACGKAEEPPPPSFGPYFRAAVDRCHAGSPVAVSCDEHACIGIARTDAEVELDMDCLSWPYQGKGKQSITQRCGPNSWRLTAVSQLPPMDSTTSEAMLKAQAERVSAALEAMPCPPR